MEILIFAIVAGVIALAFAGLRVFAVLREDEGDETMRGIARSIQLGAAAFLKSEYIVLSGLSLIHISEPTRRYSIS